MFGLLHGSTFPTSPCRKEAGCGVVETLTVVWAAVDRYFFPSFLGSSTLFGGNLEGRTEARGSEPSRVGWFSMQVRLYDGGVVERKP